MFNDRLELYKITCMHHGTVRLAIWTYNVSQGWRTGIGEIRACRITCDVIHTIVSGIWINVKFRGLVTTSATRTTSNAKTVDIEIRRRQKQSLALILLWRKI